MSDQFHLDMVLVILASAAVTYLTRIGGYVLITRLKTMPPRLEAALNAVPAAVLTTLWAPAFVYGGYDVKVTIAAAVVIGLRYSQIVTIIAALAIILLLRHGFGL
ncbi:AzlD family protein [Rhizobium sp. PAMB 3182]